MRAGRLRAAARGVLQEARCERASGREGSGHCIEPTGPYCRKTRTKSSYEKHDTAQGAGAGAGPHCARRPRCSGVGQPRQGDSRTGVGLSLALLLCSTVFHCVFSVCELLVAHGRQGRAASSSVKGQPCRCVVRHRVRSTRGLWLDGLRVELGVSGARCTRTAERKVRCGKAQGKSRRGAATADGGNVQAALPVEAFVSQDFKGVLLSRRDVRSPFLCLVRGETGDEDGDRARDEASPAFEAVFSQARPLAPRHGAGPWPETKQTAGERASWFCADP